MNKQRVYVAACAHVKQYVRLMTKFLDINFYQ